MFKCLCEHLVCQLQPLSVTSKLELLFYFPEDDDDGRPDFALLPDLVWDNIMSRLSQPDRGRLAQTCSALHASYCDSSLWNTVTITLHHNPNTTESWPFAEAASYLPMVERFGAYFEDLTLVYIGKFPMSSDCREVIQCIARCCRYEILTLRSSSRICSPFQPDENIFAQLFTNQHLKSVTLLGVICFDIRMLLPKDEMNDCLERLTLLRQYRFPSWGLVAPRETLADVSQFTQLRALYLLSPMLSDDLIVSLYDQRHVPLRELGILVIQEIRFPLPHIKVSSWTRLRAYSPCLQVHVKVVDLIPDNQLFGFLVPEMAIASLSFIEDSECADIRSIADRFSSTLRKFVDLSTSPSGLDAELVYMVTKCSHLVHLEYNGRLRVNTIRELAGLRGSRWQHFLVNLDKVVDSRDDVSIKQLAADIASLTILK